MNQSFLFIVTSAINHFRADELSRYTTQDRYKQTLETIESIKQRCPGAKICLTELSETKIDVAYEENLKSKVDYYLYFGEDEIMKELYKNFSHGDKNTFWYGKSMCETQGVILSLNYLNKMDEMNGIRRIFKITGRYLLNTNFNSDDYKSRFLKEKYICQFRHFEKNENRDNVNYHVFKNDGIFITAFWSFDISLLEETLQCLHLSYDYLLMMLLYTPGNDIEHAIYEFIDRKKLINCDVLGVTIRKGIDDFDCKI